MAVHLVLSVPAGVSAARLRLRWQGVSAGDNLIAQWLGRDGAIVRWTGEPGLPWLQRDQFADGEQWRIDLDGVPANVLSINLVAATATATTVGLLIAPLAGDSSTGVLHPGARVEADEPTHIAEFNRTVGGWSFTPLSTPFAASGHALAAPAVSSTSQNGPTSMAGPTAGPPTPLGAPAPLPSWSTAPFTHVRIPDRLSGAVDAARATGRVPRATVDVIVDLSASMRPWLVSGAVPDILTAVQAVAGAASSPAVGTRFHPADVTTRLDLETEPATVVHDHLQAAGLRTGDRAALVRSLPGPSERADDRATVLITDDPSLASGTSAVTVVLGDLPAPEVASVVAVGSAPIDIDRLAAALAERCFTTPHR